jgi:hypothetical protein
MPTASLCSEHQQPTQGSCSACQKKLCNTCVIRLSRGRTFCAACFASQTSGAGEAALRTFQKSWARFKGFQLFGVLFFIVFIFFISRLNIPSCALKTYSYLLVIPAYGLIYLYFFLKLRCPSCQSYVLFYLGDSIFETARSKFCPRCGQPLKN